METWIIAFYHGKTGAIASYYRGETGSCLDRRDAKIYQDVERAERKAAYLRRAEDGRGVCVIRR